MKLYSKKFVNRQINKKTSLRTESRDGVLWDIDWNNRICKVKIQGSGEELAAHFPQNISAHSPFMKEGNAVRIVHRGGNRGWFEVVGHGMAIPTPVSGAAHPPTSDLADMILTGCEVTAAGGLTVDIADGTYRINGVTYSITGGATGVFMTTTSPMVMGSPYAPATMGDTGEYTKMSDPSDYVMSDLSPPLTMGEVVTTFTLDAVPGGNQLRYDCFYVDTSGYINYIAGTPASSNPSKPSIPADTLLLGDYILVWTGLTEITNGNIGQEYTTPDASALEITAIDEFDWDFGDDYPETNVVVEIQDQYGFPLSGTYTVGASLFKGSGDLWSLDSGYASQVSQVFSGSSYTFKYRRDQTGQETSLYIMAQETTIGVLDFHIMALMDQWGYEVQGSQTGDVVIIPPSGTPAVDWSEGIFQSIIVDQDMTLSFSGAGEGQRLTLRLIMDGTGGWTVTLPASVQYGTEIAVAVINTDPNKRSYLGFIYFAAGSDYDLVANASGYL